MLGPFWVVHFGSILQESQRYIAAVFPPQGPRHRTLRAGRKEPTKAEPFAGALGKHNNIKLTFFNGRMAVVLAYGHAAVPKCGPTAVQPHGRAAVTYDKNASGWCSLALSKFG